MGPQTLAFAVLPLAPTFYRHRWSHRVIHWEWQIHEWSVFAVLILQFFLYGTRRKQSTVLFSKIWRNILQRQRNEGRGAVKHRASWVDTVSSTTLLLR